MLLDWFHSSQTLQVPLIEDILYSDNPQVIKWFCDRNVLSVDYLCIGLELAFGCGKLQNASYLISVLNLNCVTEHLLLLAAESDSIEAVQLLQSLPKPPLPFYTYVLPALENGHLSLGMREFLLSLCISSPGYQALQNEVLCVQSIDTLKEVFSRCGRIPSRAVSFAIQYDKPEILSECIQHQAVTTSMLYNDNFATPLDRLPPEIKKQDLLKMLEVFRSYSEDRFREEMSKMAVQTSFPVRVWVWKYLLSIQITPLIDSLIFSKSFFTVETLRFLIEEMKCPLPKEISGPFNWIRKDVLTYLRSLGVSFEKAFVTSSK